MNSIAFSLNIPAERYKSYYQGVAQNVVTTSHDGRTVQFPANVLWPFLTHSGISGEFVIEFDRRGRFVDIVRVA